ncbi:uncharacterized protein LMH87_007722 [Akanthomyces muscarius]|nr:uncharacterized protein LMH87_007722 [Akanthomyces muscarius]KAJ4142260.1 hypothetical protein LMH87_007722 [Akanthomyces muscarius]
MTDDVPAQSDNRGESQRDDAPIITGPHSIFSTNAPLAENEFPSNAPPPASASAARSAPKLLKSVESLVQEMRGRAHFSNFEEVATPSRNASTPIFPSLKRFITARFGKAEVIDKSIIESTNVVAGAAYDLFFPVNLVVTDRRGVALPGLPVEGIPDSQGYPLLYEISPKRIIRARSSGAMYPVSISRGLATKLGTYPDPGMLRAWSHMFQLDDDKSAQSILLGRVLGASAGDNHIALLLKAYFLYFDSVAGALKGVTMARNPQPAVGTVINVNTQPGWAAHVMDSGAEIVNVLGGTSDYQEFWAYCCFNQAPISATKTSLESIAGTATQFSQYNLDQRFSMVCLCDVDAYSIERDPLFFGKPELVLNYIEMYVQKFGLQEQANEALQIAMLWPSLLVAGATISLPKPLHTADWLGAEVERTSTETGYGQLTACGPFMALASTLASAWAMQSQMYDFVTLLAAGRSTWALSANTVASATAWLSANLAAPGLGWEFLFNSQFSTSASFLYLTGLSVDVVRWDTLLQPFTWKESHFPAHLRLLQPYWVESSVCCCLPWESEWLPKVSVSGAFATANPSTIMRLLRLGLLDTSAEGLERSATSHGIFPILERPGDETIAISPESTMMLYVLLQHGVRVQARFASSAVTPAVELFARGDPLDADATRKSWSLGAAAKTKASGKGSRGRVTIAG